MADATPGTEETIVPNSSGTTAPVEVARPVVSTRSKLSTGARWRTYEIEGPASTGVADAFEAAETGREEKVLISAMPLSKATGLRRAVWEVLSTQLPPAIKILTCLHAYEEDGWRYEVTSLPSATNLREWIACHQAESWVQRQMLEQLTATVSALHAAGLVHLNIRPEVIFLNEEGTRLEIILGGLESAVLFGQGGAFTAEVDPFYAPPEAVDPDGIQIGDGLRAWDWWTVGRVIQEIVLGRHVMSMLFGSDVIRTPTAPLRERAKALLLEREPPGMRAGAVESMGQLDLATKAMLRGLLTSARDARWKEEPIRLWLAKESVSNHYDLARNARFFVWKGRSRMLSEAAQFFRTQENWADGERNLFEPENPETLAHFLSNSPDQSAEWRKVKEILARREKPEWSGIPDAARRSVSAAFVWLALGPQPGALVVRGRRIDAPGLTELLTSAEDGYNVEIVKGLMSAPCLALITPLDAAAGEILTQLAKLGVEALSQAEKNNWLEAKDPSNLAYLLKLSLEAEPVLRRRADRVRTTYVACQDVVLNGLLTEKTLPPWALVALIFTGENPRHFGYVTRVEQARQFLAQKVARRQQLMLALFWLRLHAALHAGRPWAGNLRAFFLFWLGFVVIGAVVARDIPTTTGLALGLLGLRLLLGWRLRTLALRCDPAAVPWTWRDGPERCLSDAQRAWLEPVPATVAAVKKQLVETEAALVALKPDDPTLLSGRGPRLVGLWPIFAAATVLCVAGSVQLLKETGRKLGYSALSFAWSKVGAEKPALPTGGPLEPESPEDLATALKDFPGLTPEMLEKIKRGEYEIVKSAFGYSLRGPIAQWKFVPEGPIPVLPVKSRAPATAAQRAFALVSGELLVRPYGRKGVSAIFVVRVPAANGFGLMVYNARERKLANNDALTLTNGLPDNTWYRFERYKVIYLGSPDQMEVPPERTLSRN